MLKILTSVLIVLMCATATLAMPPVTLDALEVSAEFVPPHNEPVIGDRVARYRAELTSSISWGRIQWEPKITAWGVNKWRSTATIGNGADAWRNSDYSVETWRVSHTQNLSIWLTDNVAVTTEYYMPLKRKEWGGHGLECHYYWMVGFKAKLK